MNEYGAMVEWYWQGKPEVLGEKHYAAWVVGGWMRMEQLWNGTDRGNLKYWEKNIIQRGWEMSEWVWSNGGMILTGETEVLGEEHYTAWVGDEWISMEHWWKDTIAGLTWHGCILWVWVYCCTVHWVEIQLVILFIKCYAGDRMEGEEMAEHGHLWGRGEVRTGCWEGEVWIKEGGRVLSGLIWLGGVTWLTLWTR